MRSTVHQPPARRFSSVRTFIRNRRGSVSVQYGVIALFVSVSVIGSMQRIAAWLALAFELVGQAP